MKFPVPLADFAVLHLHLGNQLRCEGWQLFRTKRVKIARQVHVNQSARSAHTGEAKRFTLPSYDADHSILADALSWQAQH